MTSPDLDIATALIEPAQAGRVNTVARPMATLPDKTGRSKFEMGMMIFMVSYLVTICFCIGASMASSLF